MGYGKDERENYGVLKYALTTVRKCLNEICTSKRRIDDGNSGGPLVYCREGLKKCVQIGVSSSYSADTDYYVSTEVQRFYIAGALQNKDFITIRGDAVRYNLFSRILVPPFFAIIFILH